LEEAISPRTKIFCFSSPCNPSGTVYSKEELKAFADVFARHPGIFVISDEIYEHINFTGKHESIAQFDAMKDRVIVVNGCSKAYAMTGWRVGYIGAPLWIAKACEKMQGQITSGTCSIAQRAAFAAITSDQTETAKMSAEFEKRRNLVLKMLADVPGIKCNHPGGAFYVFPDVSSFFGLSNGEQIMMNGNDLCNYLIYHAHVTLVPGAAFGNENCVRISYATSEEKLTEALNRIKVALAKLK
ncbi:MAG: aminotransferase class I/II-fold pyridoxal phosphate-dependent enzyme, partial [Chitinophagales bacterium]